MIWGLTGPCFLRDEYRRWDYPGLRLVPGFFDFASAAMLAGPSLRG